MCVVIQGDLVRYIATLCAVLLRGMACGVSWRVALRGGGARRVAWWRGVVLCVVMRCGVMYCVVLCCGVVCDVLWCV